MKKIKNKKSAILATTLASVFLSVGSVQAADIDKKCKVTYQNEKGEVVGAIKAGAGECSTTKHGCETKNPAGEVDAWFILDKPECDAINAAVKKGDLSQLPSDLKDKVREKLDLPGDVGNTLDKDMMQDPSKDMNKK